MSGAVAKIGEDLRLSVTVTPRSSRSELAGFSGGRIKIKVKAPPVDGAANAELVRFLAKLFGVRRSAVEIRAGERCRHKEVWVRNATGFPQALSGLPGRN